MCGFRTLNWQSRNNNWAEETLLKTSTRRFVLAWWVGIGPRLHTSSAPSYMSMEESHLIIIITIEWGDARCKKNGGEILEPAAGLVLSLVWKVVDR